MGPSSLNEFYDIIVYVNFILGLKGQQRLSWLLNAQQEPCKPNH